MEEVPVAEVPAEPKKVSELVDQGLVQQLVDMGFLKQVAEKAIYLTKGEGLEKATEWIDQHCDDADFEAEYIIKPEDEAEPMEVEAEPPTGQSISTLVDQIVVSSLVEMGYSKNVAEKSMFMTQSKGIDKALEWIMEHSNDPDFEEALMIVGQSDEPAKSTSNLTKEERIEKAKELQSSIRKKRAGDELKLGRENEAQRVKSTKEMSEVKK